MLHFYLPIKFILASLNEWIMKDRWNERYSGENYVYGKNPNVFFAEQLNKLDLGTLILPCE